MESEKPIIQTHDDLVAERKRLCELVLERERLKKLKEKEGKKNVKGA